MKIQTQNLHTSTITHFCRRVHK